MKLPEFISMNVPENELTLELLDLVVLKFGLSLDLMVITMNQSNKHIIW